jgi:glutamate 5-kinase
VLPQTCSQVLLTLDNLADRSQYINARNTFTELLAYGTIPVVNENVSCAAEYSRVCLTG